MRVLILPLVKKYEKINYLTSNTQMKRKKRGQNPQRLVWLLSILALSSGSTFAAYPLQAQRGAAESTQNVSQSGHLVKGFVCDENGEPLIGAIIQVEGTNEKAVTDNDGLFSISVTNEKARVSASYVGYMKKTIQFNSKKFLSFNMIPNAKNLDEVVVVGFGKQKKESLVGAVQAVKPEDLSITSSSLTTSFAGKIPGLIAYQPKGEPGYDNAQFYIRGISTFGSNTAPLILLDGVEINSTMLNNIPPESIESFSVLKDATATSLYGSRGANGVILINTKTGRLSEKMQVNIRFDNTVSMPTFIQKMADGPTYMQMYNEASRNDAMLAGTLDQYTAPFSDEQIENTRNGVNPYVYPNNNWYKLLFKDLAMNQNLNVSVKGGTKLLEYFMNAGIFLENGITRSPKEAVLDVGLNSKKYLFQSNVVAHLTPTTKMGLNMNAQITQYHSPWAASDDGRGEYSLQDFFYASMRTSPVAFPVTLPSQPGDTFVRYGNSNSPDVGNANVNPYAKMSSGYTERSYVYMTTAFSLEQDLKFITPGLKASALASFYNYSFSWQNNWIQPYYFQVINPQKDENGQYTWEEQSIGTDGNTAIQSNAGQDPTQRVWSLQGTLDYARSFGLHNVGATFVYHMKETRIDVGGTKDQQKLLPYREQGLAGRLTYNYAERYLLEATFGYNGSENFKKGHRFGFFPAIALGWTVSNEKFFAPVKHVVTNLKLRGTYGLVGNDALSKRFPYITTVNLGQAVNWWQTSGDYSKFNGPTIKTLGNEDATWEKSKKLNIGVDLGLFNDFNLSVDFFKEKRTGIFMKRNTIPSYIGISSQTPYGNIGAVDNGGVDLGLSYNKAFNKDLILTLNGSFTYAHNEIKDKDEPENILSTYSQMGHPINSIRGYIAEGIFTSQEEVDKAPKQTLGSYGVGSVRYKDLNGDNQIDANDITTIGNPEIPEIVYGFGGTLKYKKWDLNLFFQGSAKVSLMMQNMHPFADNSHKGYNIAQYIVDNHFSMDNPDAHAKYPRLSVNPQTNDTQVSTLYLRDASYLRLKSAELGYTFNKWLRVYVAGSNLLTFAPFKDWDPEMGSGNGLNYPLQRTVKVGVQFHY